MPEPITVDMVAPFLTERGRIEVEFALQSLHLSHARAELAALKAHDEDE